MCRDEGLLPDGSDEACDRNIGCKVVVVVFFGLISSLVGNFVLSHQQPLEMLPFMGLLQQQGKRCAAHVSMRSLIGRKVSSCHVTARI